MQWHMGWLMSLHKEQLWRPMEVEGCSAHEPWTLKMTQRFLSGFAQSNTHQPLTDQSLTFLLSRLHHLSLGNHLLIQHLIHIPSAIIQTLLGDTQPSNYIAHLTQ